MSLSIKAVIFDWAWTLVDLGDEDDRRPFLRMFEFLKEKGVVLPDHDDCYRAYRELFYKMIGESKQTHREACFDSVLKFLLQKYSIDITGKTTIEELLRKYYKDIYSTRSVFPDVVPTLQSLRSSGLPLAIISNTTNPPFMKDYERELLGLDPYFEFSIYSSGVPYRKPHPSIFKLATSRLQLKEHEVLYVGDDPVNDVAGAQKVGMQAVWVNRDDEKIPDGIHPDFEVHSLTELLEINCIKV
jgi:putative hydrolase of the HAD superfamily